MEISMLELESIAQTLPIGLYAKRRVNVGLEEDAPTSYYVPTEDKVVLSYKQLATTLQNMGEIAEKDREMAIRSNLYHEISHAILTPMNMSITDIINIFEDERIETLLRAYYLNVNFKKMVVLMNGYKGEKPTDPKQAFYHCVRFRNYKPQFVARVDEIIKRYATLNRFTDAYYDRSRWRYGTPNVWNYVDEINQLYKDIAEDFKADASSSGSGSDGTKSAFGSPMDIMGGTPKEDGDETEMGESAEFDISALDDDVMGEFMDTELVGEIMSGVFNGFTDTSLESALSMIIENFKKKNSKGSAIHSYSGVLNPRNCARDDYRFFDKALSTNGSNQFGTLHLNLFIDVSGSFCSNETVVNTLINALSKVERQNKNFSLDMVLCSEGQKLITDKKDRFIKCCGGNWVTDEIYDTFRKLQKPNTYNYNIVLFDGDAYSDNWIGRSRGETKGKSLSAFDKNNCTIISDSDNKRYMDKYIKTAKIIYTNDYANELIDNVKKVLGGAFR